MLALVAAAAFDLGTRRIPDWITLPILAGALAVRTASGGAESFVRGILGVGFASAFAAPLAAWGRMGWGDAKLLAGVGAIFGWPRVGEAMFAISLCGAVQAVAALVGGKWFARGRGVTVVAGEAGSASSIPYGVAIAAGTALAALPIIRG